MISRIFNAFLLMPDSPDISRGIGEGVQNFLNQNYGLGLNGLGGAFANAVQNPFSHSIPGVLTSIASNVFDQNPALEGSMQDMVMGFLNRFMPSAAPA